MIYLIVDLIFFLDTAYFRTFQDQVSIIEHRYLLFMDTNELILITPLINLLE